jgi:hypothetical protein
MASLRKNFMSFDVRRGLLMKESLESNLVRFLSPEIILRLDNLISDPTGSTQ